MNIFLRLAISSVLVICAASEDEDVLSKFTQSDYKLKDIFTKMEWYNTSLVRYFNLTTFKYNRTTPAINASFNYKVDVQDHIEVLVQVYKFLSNEFRVFPIRIQVNAQKAYRANVGGMQDVSKCGNMKSFYFYKDVDYYVRNFVYNINKLPPLIPSGRFKVQAFVLYLNQKVAIINGFGEIYRPLPYTKK